MVQCHLMDRATTDDGAHLTGAIVLVTIWPFVNVASALVTPLLKPSLALPAFSFICMILPLAASVLVMTSWRRGRHLGASRAAVLGIAVVEGASVVGILWITALQCWSPLCGN